jgi:hypothetical protein
LDLNSSVIAAMPVYRTVNGEIDAPRGCSGSSCSAKRSCCRSSGTATATRGRCVSSRRRS